MSPARRAQLIAVLRARLDGVERVNAALPEHLGRVFAIVAERLRIWLDDPTCLHDEDELRDIIARIEWHGQAIKPLIAEHAGRGGG